MIKVKDMKRTLDSEVHLRSQTEMHERTNVQQYENNIGHLNGRQTAPEGSLAQASKNSQESQ